MAERACSSRWLSNTTRSPGRNCSETCSQLRAREEALFTHASASRPELQRDRVLRVVNHPREAAPRRVEARERLVWQSAGREPARLCREADGAHAACAEAGRRPWDEVLRVELQVGHVKPEGGGVVAAVVLEADGDGGEEGEGVGVVARELLDDVEACVCHTSRVIESSVGSVPWVVR